MGSGIGKRAREVVKPALERIEQLEKDLRSLLGNQLSLREGSTKAFGLVENRLNVMEKCVDAVIDVVGRPQVEAAIIKSVQEDAQKRADADKAAIEDAVKDGKLLVGDIIGEQSVIAGREIKKDGTVLIPGWEQLHFSQLKPENQALALGKRAGDRFEIEIGEFEILNVYEIAPNPPEAPEAGTEGAVLEAAAPDQSEADAEKALDEYLASVKGAEPGVEATGEGVPAESTDKTN